MHIPPQVIGYMAVQRTPQHMAYDFPYRGTDRDPWWGYFQPFYEGRLPPPIAKMLEPALTLANFSGIEICTEITSLARIDLKNYCPDCEIIGLWSPLLSKMRSPDIVPNATFLGFEVRILGEFSLILSGQLSDAHTLATPLSHLNQHGLFDDIETARIYAREYRRAADAGLAEYGSLAYEVISIYHLYNC